MAVHPAALAALLEAAGALFSFPPHRELPAQEHPTRQRQPSTFPRAPRDETAEEMVVGTEHNVAKRVQAFPAPLRALPADSRAVLLLGEGNFSFALALARRVWGSAADEAHGVLAQQMREADTAEDMSDSAV